MQEKIQTLEVNIVALRKAADEQWEKLTQLKNVKEQQSASLVRRNLKQKRIEEIAKNYMTKWKLKSTRLIA